MVSFRQASLLNPVRITLLPDTCHIFIVIIIIIIIIIIILILVMALLQDTYNYTPETNHVDWVHSVTAVLYLQFVLHVTLFRPLNVLFLH
jgi:uncharacterized protein YpmB